MGVKDLFSLEGKVSIVTGAAGLIGKRHCEALAGAGSKVVAVDLDSDSCEEIAAYLPTDSVGFGADICDPDSLNELKISVLDKFGRIDVLINNAAINDMVENPAAAAELSKFENYPLDLFRKVLDVNVTGVFLTSRIIGSVMAERGKGSVINVASTYGVVAPDQSLYVKPDGTQPFFKSPVYPTSKGAVLQFTRFLAAYWGKSGVRVNALSPGGVENNQEEYFIENYSKRTPLNRMAAPNDYEGAVVFLASDASSYMTGANLIVDGGWTAW